MRCEKCGENKMGVKDSRLSNHEGRPAIRRRRQCAGCGRQVITLETIIANDGRVATSFKKLSKAAATAAAALEGLRAAMADTREELT